MNPKNVLVLSLVNMMLLAVILLAFGVAGYLSYTMFTTGYTLKVLLELLGSLAGAVVAIAIRNAVKMQVFNQVSKSITGNAFDSDFFKGRR